MDMRQLGYRLSRWALWICMAACGGVPRAPQPTFCDQSALAGCDLPDWYKEHTSTDNLVLVGLGCANLDHSAGLEAKAVIAGQIRTQICTKGWFEKVSRNGRIDDNYGRSMEEATVELLVGAHLSHQARICDGRFVAIRHELDLHPAEFVLARYLRAGWGGSQPSRLDWKGPSLLQRSDFKTALERLLVADGAAGVVRSVHFELRRKSGLWLVAANDIIASIVLRISGA